MTISGLIISLQKVEGSGYKAVFETPDGKLWEIAEVNTLRNILENKVENKLILKEVEQGS